MHVDAFKLEEGKYYRLVRSRGRSGSIGYVGTIFKVVRMYPETAHFMPVPYERSWERERGEDMGNWCLYSTDFFEEVDEEEAAVYEMAGPK